MKFIIIIALVISGYLLYTGIDLYNRVLNGRALVKDTQSFELKTGDPTKTVLVLGDSTAVGVGTVPEKSIAGLLTKEISATWVENYAVSGAHIQDVKAQLGKAERTHYDLVLLQVGANDIIARNKVDESIKALRPLIEAIQKNTDQVIHLSAGNIGAADAIPFFAKPYYHNLTKKYHEAFKNLAQELGSTYINLYIPPKNDPFLKEPRKYLAVDGLHPTDKGYALWFEKVKPVVQ